uniref:Protein bric-a-brac 2 n=1 Tax=Cacopsylla melanoneura TaxID=428564 RepID=A0A8D9DVP3_9HEMI
MATDSHQPLLSSDISDLNKRRQCKFIPEWTLRSDFAAWLVPVDEDPHKAFCVYCKKLFPVSHGGLHDVKAHAKGKRHLLLTQQYFRNNSSFFSTNPFQVPGINHDWSQVKPPIFDSPSVDVSVNTRNIPFNLFNPVADSMSSRHRHIPDTSQQYCLRWKYHHSNLQLMFSQLLERESFCDVTLACEGKHIRAHKVMLSACSTYFDAIFSQHNENNPIVVFKDVRFEDLKALVQFMYKGEIKIENTQLTPLLKTAEELRIKGLAEVSWRDPHNASSSTSREEREEALEDEEDEEEMCMTPPKRARMSESSVNRPYPGLLPGVNIPWKQHAPLTMSTPKKTVRSTPDPKSNQDDDDIEIINDQHHQHHPGSKNTTTDMMVMNQRVEQIGNNKMRRSHEGVMRSNEGETDEGMKRGRGEGGDEVSDNERDLNQDELDEEDEDDDEMPMPIAPETVYDNPDMDDDDEDRLHVHEERNIFSEEEEDRREGGGGGEWEEEQSRRMRIMKKGRKDENGNEEEDDEEEEFEMPGMPAHLTSSSFSTLLDEDEFNKTNTSTEEKTIDYSKYSYVIKMNDFLDQGGRRPQFWDEPSTRRVMEAIKNKELEMKQGAEIMGVSYGTLYGRYRDAYGCLKHPYRVKEFWSEQGPSEILAKLRRKELSLFRAAELLNVTVTTLANYIATLRHPSPDLSDGDYAGGETPLSLFGSGGEASEGKDLKPEGKALGPELKPEITVGNPDGN